MEGPTPPALPSQMTQGGPYGLVPPSYRPPIQCRRADSRRDPMGVNP